MFHAFRRWVKDGHLRVIGRLFLFEFLVVVAGVLAAQGLTSWVNRRAEDKVVNEQEKRIRYEIGRARQVARVWLTAAPCLEQKLDMIVRKAGTDAPFTSEELHLPQFRGYTIDPPPPELVGALRERISAASLDDYLSASSASQNLVDAYREVRRNWDLFALVDPALGQPLPGDRARVREAAIQARSQVRRLQPQAQAVEDLAAGLRIAPLGTNAISGTMLPVRQCAQIWARGRIWREPGEGLLR